MGFPRSRVGHWGVKARRAEIRNWLFPAMIGEDLADLLPHMDLHIVTVLYNFYTIVVGEES
jgi:hypothetical protein